MNTELFLTPTYKKLMEEHISKTISFLFDNTQDFALACQIEHTNFSPMLPESIIGTFDETVLFIISGYTFESAQVEKEYFSFEAGFGSENFGSVVTVPLLAIKQIFVNDHPIVINYAEYDKEEVFTEKIETQGKKNSMETLLNNPENKKLLKRKK